MTLVAKRVLIIGGGFSGMSAAIQLRKVGVIVDLIEIDQGWRSYGAGITIGGATLRALGTVGVVDEVVAQGWCADGVDLHTADGSLIASLPTPRLAGPGIPGGGAIMRPVLAQILARATRAADVDVRLGCTFSSISQDAEGVEVVTTDGEVRRYDLVVGADGLFSKVRQELFADAPKPRYTGQAVWRAVLPRPEEIDHPMMWIGNKVKTGVNPVSHKQMYLFVTEDRPINDYVDPAQWPRMLADLLAPFPTPLMQRLRGQLDAGAQVIYRPLESLLLPLPWAHGRVVLIGDAAHATTPHMASGAGIGIEDAIVLAEELGRSVSVESALAKFQSRRWERCRMVVENSGRLGELEVSNGDKAEHSRLMRETLSALAQPI